MDTGSGEISPAQQIAAGYAVDGSALVLGAVVIDGAADPAAQVRMAPAQNAEPGMLEQMMDNPAFKSAMRSAGTVIGREITRSIFGTGRRGRR